MKFGALVLGLLLSINLLAQDTVSTPQSKSNPVVLNKAATTGAKTTGLSYENEFSMGAKVATLGWSIFADYTKDVDYDKKRVIYTELEFLKSPKETKRVNEYTIGFTPPKPFIYGKQNSFFNFKAGIGEKRLIGEKADKSGFQISANYGGGFSAGFVKPYYLEVLNENRESNDLTIPVKYSPETEQLFLDAITIYGASGFATGLNEISVVPGIFAKGGLNFDWATYDDFVKSAEAGIGAELYLKDIPIMIQETNKPYFVYLYLSLQFGKKW
jgi:hypothetical protein